MTTYAFRGDQCANLARRRTVANWLEAALQDGILLCKLMNTLRPNDPIQFDIPHDDPTETESRGSQNLLRFISAAKEFGLDPEYLFTVEDVMDDTWRDRPRVVECLYTLQRKADEISDDRLSRDGDGTYICDSSYSTDSQRTDSVYDYSTSALDGADAEVDFTTPRGINKLMDQCTTILRDRGNSPGVHMKEPLQKNSIGVPGNGNAMRCLESMLKQILTGITTAQERRGRRYLEESEKHIKSLEDQIELLQNQPQAVVRDSSGLTNDEVISLRKTCEELRQKLEEYQQEAEELKDKLKQQQSEKEELEKQIDTIQGEVQSLDLIRDKYKVVQQENSKLYNMVQDLRGNIRVFCRVRPSGVTGDGTNSVVSTDIEDGKILVGNGSRPDKQKAFKFDKVFGQESTQEEVYAECQPLIRSVLDGYNVCIFAYGQTGSGKTHTMSGTDVDEYGNRGINYRALDDLFGIKQDRSDEVDYEIHVQMLEIYNENLRDLLFDYSGGKLPPKLEIQSTKESGSNVRDAVQEAVGCTEDVLRVMEMGQQNRSVGSTAMNQRSSRSHSVLTVIVHGHSHVTQEKTLGCLHLVDLAGSERVGRSEATGDRLKEAQSINRSLSALGDVMSGLAAKNSHVPFRNSKLTQLLKDSLSGQAKSTMFMHVSPEQSSERETLSTLNFGFRVSQITLGQAGKNVEKAPSFDALNKLKEAASAKDKKIVELERVIESERAIVRKAESDKQALEKQLISLREELQLSQRSLLSSRGYSRRRAIVEEGGTSNGGQFKRTPPPIPFTVKESDAEDSASAQRRSSARTINSTSEAKESTSRRLMGKKKSIPSSGGGTSQRDASSRGSPPPPLPRKSRFGRLGHRKTLSTMTSRDVLNPVSAAASNPRRAAMNKSKETAKAGSRWR